MEQKLLQKGIRRALYEKGIYKHILHYNWQYILQLLLLISFSYQVSDGANLNISFRQPQMAIYVQVLVVALLPLNHRGRYSNLLSNKSQMALYVLMTLTHYVLCD